jgi:glycosyltransferase involved in cell wall biosynthesis
MSAAREVGALAVIIPAYNAELTIERAILSARDAGAAEIIVVDDGSSDGTVERARAAGATCISQSNAGAAKARVVGAEHAQSAYLNFLDADDELIGGAVRRSVEKLESDPELAVAAGTVIGFGDGRGDVPFPIRYSPVNSLTLLTEGYGPWPPAAAVVRRSAYEAARTVHPSPLHPRYAEDYELLIRLSIVGGIDVRDEATARYSLSGGKSARSASSAIAAKEQIRAHYASALGVDITLMSPRDIERAALIRVARGKWAAGDRLGTLTTMIGWFARNPIGAVRTLASAPWKRN